MAARAVQNPVPTTRSIEVGPIALEQPVFALLHPLRVIFATHSLKEANVRKAEVAVPSDDGSVPANCLSVRMIAVVDGALGRLLCRLGEVCDISPVDSSAFSEFQDEDTMISMALKGTGEVKHATPRSARAPPVVSKRTARKSKGRKSVSVKSTARKSLGGGWTSGTGYSVGTSAASQYSKAAEETARRKEESCNALVRTTRWS